MCYTIQHRTVLIIFTLILQTIIIAQMLSNGGKRNGQTDRERDEQTQTQTERQRDRQTDRQTDTERSRLTVLSCRTSFHLCPAGGVGTLEPL